MAYRLITVWRKLFWSNRLVRAMFRLSFVEEMSHEQPEEPAWPD